MDFNFNEEQGLFKDAIDRLVAKQYGFEQRRRYQAEAEGFSRAIWAQFADQGFLAMPFDAAYGGLGYGAVETMIVMEAMGRGLVVEPYLASVVLCGSALSAAGNVAQLEALVPAIAGGEAVFAFAHAERQSRYRLSDVALRATRKGEAYVLSGEKTGVLNGNAADRVIVSARTSGERQDAQGISLFVVDTQSAGLRRRSYRTQDGLMAADLLFDEVVVNEADRVGAVDRGLAIVERVSDCAIAALAAESAGIMQATLDLTVDYLKQRNQFGGAIGRFQALQHRAAEMLIELEQTRSMACYAALMLDEPDLVERRKALSAVKAQIGKAGRIVGQLAIQLHGGIGVTEEYAVGHYFRRLSMIETSFGDSAFHLQRVADAGGFVSAELA